MNGDHICSMYVPNHYHVCIQTIFPQNFNITTGSPKLKCNQNAHQTENVQLCGVVSSPFLIEESVLGGSPKMHCLLLKGLFEEFCTRYPNKHSQ